MAAELGSLFKTFTRSAWRLEALDNYTVPSETEILEDFLAGKELAPRTPDNDGWMALLRDFKATGRTAGRVHVVSQPLSPYVRFELALYADSVRWGEDVRIADRSLSHDGFADLAKDFWIFDDTTVAVMRYDDEGQFHGIDLAEDSSPYLRLQQRALDVSVPYQEFMERSAIGS